MKLRGIRCMIAEMNRKLRARVLAKRQHHTDTQNAKRKAGEKEPPRIRRKQVRKPRESS